MSVHTYAMDVAGDLARRLDVDGLKRVRAAQLQHEFDVLAAEALRGRKRRTAWAEADRRYREAIRDA